MPSSIEVWFDAIVSAYDAELPGITWLYGARHLSGNHAWPKVIAVRPSAVWGALSHGGTEVAAASGETRALYNRRSQLDWHIWAADEESAEAIAANISVLYKQVAGGSSRATFAIVSEEWPAEIDDGPIAHGGLVVVLRTEIVHRISDEFNRHPVTVVDSVSHKGTFGPNDEVVC